MTPRPFSYLIVIALVVVALVQVAMVREFDQAARTESPRGVDAGFPLDDAWIHHVYARSLAERGRLEYNTGELEAGQSSLLWGVLLAPLHTIEARTGYRLGSLTRALGGLIWILVALATAGIVGTTAVPGARFGAVAAAFLVAFDPGLAYCAASGMEPLLLALFGLLSVFFAIKERPGIAGVCVGLATLARPEGILFLVAPLWSAVASKHGTLLGRTTRLLVPTVLLPSIWIGFCLTATSRPLPNTWYAKRTLESAQDFLGAGGSAIDGIRLLADELARSPFYLGYVGYLFLGIGLISLFFRTPPRVWAPLVLLPPLYFVAIAVTREMPLPEAFFWHRYLLPAVPLLHILLAVGYAATGGVLLDIVRRPGASARVQQLIDEEEGRRERILANADDGEEGGATESIPMSADATEGITPSGGSLIPDPLLGILLALLLVVPFAGAPERLHAARNAFGADVACIDTMNVAGAEWLKQNSPADAVVAAQDAGASRYFGERTIVDVIGLNDHRWIDIGLSGGDVGRYLLERRPDYFFLLEPDPGGAELIGLARSLGMRERSRFEVEHYSPFLSADRKGIVIYGK